MNNLAVSHNKRDALKKMTVKMAELQNELNFYKKGTEQIAHLFEDAFYEVHTDRVVGDTLNILCKCISLGRDHAEFTPLAINNPNNLALTMILSWKKNGNLSLWWSENWSYKPADDLTLYVHYTTKTRAYEKLLKKRKNSKPI